MSNPDQYLQFNTKFCECTSEITVTLEEVWKRPGHQWLDRRTVGRKSFTIIWWWHTPSSIGCKINKIQEKLMNSYYYKRKTKELLIEACDKEFSRGMHVIQDAKTSDYIEKLKNNTKKD